MLFRQRPVEQQQIAPIVDRRRGVLGRQAPAAVAAFGVGVRLHDAERRTLASGGLGQLRQPVERRVDGCDAQIGVRCTIQAETFVSAVAEEILQLDGPPLAYAPFAQGVVERAVAVGQFALHEDLPHERIDEGRVHAVPAEEARPRQMAAEPFGVAAEPVSVGHVHRLSWPASRPVEKAI